MEMNEFQGEGGQRETGTGGLQGGQRVKDKGQRGEECHTISTGCDQFHTTPFFMQFFQFFNNIPVNISQEGDE